MPLPDHTTLNFGPWYRRSPFFEATLRAGCSAYDVYQHMYHPNTYGDPVEEYWALVNDVTLWDVSVERIVEITGPDATAFTNLLTCRDLTTCAGEAGQVHARHRRGRRHRERPGPAARRGEPLVARARRLRRRPLRDGRRGQLRDGRARRPPRGLPGAGPGPEGQGHDARPVRRPDPGHEVLLVRRGRPRRHPRRDQPDRLDRGGRLRDLPARPEPRRRPVGADPRRRQALRHPRHALVATSARIEAGIFDWGSDFGLETNPFEVTGLERLVEHQEADYIGKEALERIRREGVSRKLVGIELEGEPVEQPTQHWPASHGGRDGRPRHRRVLVTAPGEEHRLRLGADRARGARHPPRRSRPTTGPAPA